MKLEPYLYERLITELKRRHKYSIVDFHLSNLFPSKLETLIFQIMEARGIEDCFSQHIGSVAGEICQYVLESRPEDDQEFEVELIIEFAGKLLQSVLKMEVLETV